MPKQSSGSSRNFNERPIDDDANNFEALKARVGTTVNIFTLIFALIAVLAPSSVYIYELLYSEEPPTVWWLETVIETDLKDLTISVVDKDTLPTIQTSNKDTEWVKSNLRISRRWSEGTYCGSDRSLARHSTGNSTNTKHRKSAVSHSTGFIFDAMYTDYRAYVSILLKDNTQSLCDTRAVITDSSSSSSSSTSSTYNDSMYANRTWLHVPKVYPKAFICRFYDHKSKLMASSSSQSVIAGYYVRCPVPTQVRSRHKLLMRLQWYEDAPIVSDSGKARYMRSRNQSSVAGSSASVGFKRESKMASHFSHLFPVCSFLSAEYHTGRSLTASGIAVGSDGSTLSSSVAVDTSIGTTNSTGFSSRLSQFSPFRNHSKSTAVTVDSDKDLISQYNVSVCTSVGLGVLGYTNTDRHHLLEWLEYHRVLGAEHFFMYDLARYSTNKNASGTSSSSNRPLNLSLKEILAPYISTGVVTLIPWQEPSCQSARTGGTSDDVDDVCDQSDVDASSESLPADYESVFKNEIERYRHTGGASVDININVKGSKADRTEYKTDNIVSSSTLSKSDRRRKRADRLQVRAMQSCYLRHRESSRWMTFLSSDEFIGVNSHHR